MVGNYRDLNVWQKAMGLAVDCYRSVRSYPDHEKYGLRSQMQRAAVSIPSNIAEGNARGTTGAYVNHLWIANGSLAELETQILLSERFGYLDHASTQLLLNQTDQIGRMLTGLRKSLGD